MNFFYADSICYALSTRFMVSSQHDNPDAHTLNVCNCFFCTFSYGIAQFKACCEFTVYSKVEEGMCRILTACNSGCLHKCTVASFKLFAFIDSFYSFCLNGFDGIQCYRGKGLPVFFKITLDPLGNRVFGCGNQSVK